MKAPSRDMSTSLCTCYFVGHSHGDKRISEATCLGSSLKDAVSHTESLLESRRSECARFSDASTRARRQHRRQRERFEACIVATFSRALRSFSSDVLPHHRRHDISREFFRCEMCHYPSLAKKNLIGLITPQKNLKTRKFCVKYRHSFECTGHLTIGHTQTPALLILPPLTANAVVATKSARSPVLPLSPKTTCLCFSSA